MATTVYRRLRLRRDLEANLPALAQGELFFCTDSHKIYIGTDGTLAGNLRIF